MSFVEIKNKRNTSDKKPPNGYTSWLNFWEMKKDLKATSCLVTGCGGKAEVGGHVIKSGPKEYILPICKSCNNKPDGEIFQTWDTDLVPVVD